MKADVCGSSFVFDLISLAVMNEMFNRNANGVRDRRLAYAPAPLALGLNISLGRARGIA